MSITPSHLDKYELIERLGQGGVAEVWKARDTQLQRFVALKVLHPDLRDDPEFLIRFQREAQLVAGLHHPHIINVHDFQIFQGTTNQPIAYMVMDYIEGPTLASYIRTMWQERIIPTPGDLVHLFTAISLAIDYAHRQGMIHRDIKPANILLDQHDTSLHPLGEPVLTDFGIAKMLSHSSTQHTGIQFGTPAYIAPEQIRGDAGNPRSDLYALGVILYEMTTGVLPFSGDSAIDVMSQQLEMTPLTPALINPQLSPALVQVIMRSLSKDPALRFSSAGSMAAAIARALGVPVPEILQIPTEAGSNTQLPTVRLKPATDVPVTPLLHTLITGTGPEAQTAAVKQPPTDRVSPIATLTRMPQKARPGSRYLPGILIGLLIIVILGSFAAWLVPPLLTPASDSVGQAFYTSSGQIVSETTRGLSDQLQIDIQKMPTPANGNSYYAWLLGDEKPPAVAPSEIPSFQLPLLLTNNLPVVNGQVHYLFPGTPAHENLLSVTSRLLITEEAAGRQPEAPSQDQSSWRYFASIPQQVIPDSNFSALEHIRHLLYNDTRPGVIPVPGGTDFWLTRNTAKVLEWSVAARDSWYGDQTSSGQLGQIRNHMIRILNIIDGIKNVHIDLPPGTPILVTADQARGALLTVDPVRQGPADPTNPEGHLDHAQFHVGLVARARDISENTRLQTSRVLDALKNAKVWLSEVRRLAIEIFQQGDTNPSQMFLDEAGLMLDNLVSYATYTYIGQLDPVTNTIRPGIIQAHYDLQKIAMLPITRTLPTELRF